MIDNIFKFSTNEIATGLEEFYKLYNSRPIKDNQGGMKSPHLFNTWLLVKKINSIITKKGG